MREKEEFSRLIERGRVLLQYKPWLEGGIDHGFAGKEIKSGESDATGVEEFFGGLPVYYLEQVHGRRIIDLRKTDRYTDVPSGSKAPLSLGEADGIIIGENTGFPGVFCVRTADCAPVLIRSGSETALVHAGWRGLAADVIENVILALSNYTEVIEILIGPCARECCYEVGKEVVESVGRGASYALEKSRGKFMLNIALTAANKAAIALKKRGVSRNADIIDTGICTICNSDFYSYRRSVKEKRKQRESFDKRNLSYVKSTS